MCWKCDAVRAARAYDEQQWGRSEPFDIDASMLDSYAQRHGVTRDQAEDAFIFAAGGIQPSRMVH